MAVSYTHLDVYKRQLVGYFVTHMILFSSYKRFNGDYRRKMCIRDSYSCYRSKSDQFFNKQY